jgi:hypothetical protein
MGWAMHGTIPTKTFIMPLFSGRQLLSFFDNVSRQYDGVRSETTGPGMCEVLWSTVKVIIRPGAGPGGVHLRRKPFVLLDWITIYLTL